MAASRAACSADSRGFGAEHAIPPLDDVQVQLEDATLVEDRLQHQRDDRLLALAKPRSRSGQEQVLRQLLGDRRPAGDDPPALLVLLDRKLDAIPVEPLVLDELRVLGGDHRPLEGDGYALVRHELIAVSLKRAM